MHILDVLGQIAEIGAGMITAFTLEHGTLHYITKFCLCRDHAAQ
jgi:hypothetical protein